MSVSTDRASGDEAVADEMELAAAEGQAFPRNAARQSSGAAEVPARQESFRRFLLATGTLWQREMVRFFRQPSRVIGAFGSPLVFWLVIGSGLGRSFQLPGAVADDA